MEKQQTKRHKMIIDNTPQNSTTSKHNTHINKTNAQEHVISKKATTTPQLLTNQKQQQHKQTIKNM